ncbi:MAG TPA: hypothetical protein VGN31_05355 [Paraburkholderia sp.]
MVAGMSAARRDFLSSSTGAGIFAALASSQVAAAASTALFRNQLADDRRVVPNREHDGAHDFDFYFGRWRVHNERLRERLVGSTDWQHFDAIQECRPILGGLGNLDEFVTDEFGPGVFLGMTLRLFDRATRQWSIWWASNRKGGLDAPVVGAFANGIGCFEGDDTHNGVPVRSRFIWSGIEANRALWEQAFSSDGGRTWETNWRMHMTRLAAYQPATGGVS